MARINKVAHVVLDVKDFEASTKFYVEALGMEVVAYNPELRWAFLSFGDQHHDIAVFQAPERFEHSELGLNHIAMEIEGGVEGLNQLHQRLVDCGARIENIIDHGLTKSVFFFDPDGNRLELMCNVMEPEDAKERLRKRHGDPPAWTAKVTPVVDTRDPQKLPFVDFDEVMTR